MTTERRYGGWDSPISAEMLVRGAAGISEVQVDGDDVYWAESRPDEAGRTAIMRWRSGEISEVSPLGANVRTLVHEYGGGAWLAVDRSLYWVDLADQVLRRTSEAGETIALTSLPEVERGHRYADGRLTPDGGRFVCVRERHRADGSEAVNEIVSVATDGSQRVDVLADGADFYSSPRPSPDGDRLAWLQWNHPDMPWDGTELWVGSLSDGSISGAARVAGSTGEAIVQPEWGPDDQLLYVSDRSDRWSVYRLDRDEPLVACDGDLAMPPWVFGQSSYAVRADGAVVAVEVGSGGDRLVGTDALGDYSSIESLRLRNGEPVYAAASWASETAVVVGNEIVRPARDLGLDDGFFTPPEPITFPTSGGDVAHGLYYAPAHPDRVAPADERPPLIVMAHGGPTSAARTQLSLALRYWTSRGFAVVDVDYRGSSGYGRAYRKALDGGWGLRDVDDCVAAAQFLVGRGDVDPERLVIRGGSAGGYTVLCALAYHDVFAVGASRYGICDLEALALDTHKFESRYLDRLIGPYPEAIDVYQARSPIHHVEGFAAPMIILQGSEDAVVPPAQSRRIVDALAAKGVPVAYLEFEGEQHGFRNAPNIVRALEAELWFYGAMLGFDPADQIPPVEIVGGVGDDPGRR